MAEHPLFHTLSMCRFCTKEFPDCGANPIRSKDIHLPSGKLDEEDSVVACSQYESPVEILKKKFH